jgi:hypothetical protein
MVGEIGRDSIASGIQITLIEVTECERCDVAVDRIVSNHNLELLIVDYKERKMWSTDDP